MGADLVFAVDWLGQCHPGQHSDTAKISAAFGKTKYIHLSPQDKVAEAVSLVRAEQSGVWHRAADGSVLESMPVNDPSGYDAALIASTVLRLGHLDVAWHDWFADMGVAPLQLSYEELAQDPCTALAQVLHHIGQDPSKAASVTPGTRNLSDAVNAEWIARFHADRPASM